MYQQGFKFVLVGPVGSGKTTALTALSDMAPVSTEMPLSDGPMGEKTTTTVALDFSTILLDDGTPLQLFGLPGQEHFSHMRSIVMQGALGALVLLPGDDPEIATQCAHWIRIVAEIDADLPVAIGITRTDMAPHFRMDGIRQVLAGRMPPVPVMTIDAREREQVSQLVRALLLMME